MRKILTSLAVVIVIFLTFQACGPNSDSAKSRKIVDAVVATPPLGYVAGEVFGGNWLSTAGNQQNYQMLLRKSSFQGLVGRVGLEPMRNSFN